MKRVALTLTLTLTLTGLCWAAADGGDPPDGGTEEKQESAGQKEKIAKGTAPRRAYNDGRKAFSAGDLAQAEAGFLYARDQAEADDELRYRAAFNLGLVEVRKADGMKDKPQEALHLLEQGAAWFRDAVRVKKDDDDARVNLELVLRRVREVSDQLNKAQGGLEARLGRVIQDQRTLRDQVRGLLGRVKQAGGGTEPLAFQGEYEEAATFERTLLADAGAVLDLGGQERDGILAKPEAQRKDEERGRLVQLDNLDHYLNEARGTMAEVGRLLRRLQGERAHRQAEVALEELKRALEQLLDPVTVMKGLAADQAGLFGQTQALVKAETDAQHLAVSGAATAAPAGLPPWLTSATLGAEQQDLRPRAAELLARLKAGVEHGAPDAKEGDQGGAEAAKTKRILQAAREAIPPLEEAGTAMERASAALLAGQAGTAAGAQVAVLAALGRALERFSGLRDLIELAYGEQGQVVALLTPGKLDKQVALSTQERVRLLGESVGRNRERLERLKGMFAEEVQAAEEKAKAPAQQGQGQDQQALEAEKERFRLAEEKRQQADAALARLAGEVSGKGGAAAKGTAEEALHRIEELRRLFFSIVEHLKELHREQTETHDKTGGAAALKDEAERLRQLGPAAEAQERHAQMGKALGDALAAQADQAAQAPAGGGQSQGSQETQKLSAAAAEVQKATAAMQGAARELKEDVSAPMTPELEPVLGQQKEALDHLEQALRILEPPQQKQQDQKDQKQQQQEQQQVSQEQAARRLQAIREREAERQREEHKRQRTAPEPVDKDW